MKEILPMKPSVSCIEEKSALRRKIREAKKDLLPEMRAQASEELWRRLEQHPRFQTAQTVLLYHSLPDEPDTSLLLRRWSGRKTLLLPVVVGEELELRPYTGEEDLHSGAFGILEPQKTAVSSVMVPDFVLVPGVAFDRDGNRLGRGKGYYDRLLSQPQYKEVYKMGCAFDFQISDHVPSEPFDVRMDGIL